MGNYINIAVLPHIEGAEEYDILLDSACCTEAEVLEQIIEKLEVDGVKGAEDLQEFTVTDWGGLPDNLQDWEVLAEMLPEYEVSHYDDLEIWEAAKDADVPFSDVDEAYNGEFSDDEAFVEDLLEQVGDLPKDLPHYIFIDWGMTAECVMQDYSEANGHYFRNL